MDDVFSLIIDMFGYCVDSLSGATFTALGYTFSLLDFFLAFLLLDLIVPLVLLVRSPRKGAAVSERNRKKDGSDA